MEVKMKVHGLPWSLLLFCITLKGVGAQYQWSCSPLDAANNRYILPDLGIRDQRDVIAIRSRLTGSDESMTYFFPIPSTLNCNGTVSAMQYCYISNGNGSPQTIFMLLILEQNDLTFTITDTIPVVSTQSSGICDRSIPIIGTIYCCDTFQLNNLILPTPNFAFGIIAVSSPQLLTFDANMISENEQFFVEHFRFPAADLTPTIGTTITLSESDRNTDQALRVLQFMITAGTVLSVEEIATTAKEPTNTTSATTSPNILDSPIPDDVQLAIGRVAGGVTAGVVIILIISIAIILTIIFIARRINKRKPSRMDIFEVTENDAYTTNVSNANAVSLDHNLAYGLYNDNGSRNVCTLESYDYVVPRCEGKDRK